METNRKEMNIQGAFLTPKTWNFLHVNQAEFILPKTKKEKVVVTQEYGEKMPIEIKENISLVKGSLGDGYDEWLNQWVRKKVFITFTDNETKQLDDVLTSGQQAIQQIYILAKKGCHAKVIHKIASSRKGSASLYQSVKVRLEEGAVFTYEQVQMLGEGYHFYSDLACEEEKDAKFTITRINFGAKETKIGLAAYLKGERSEISSNLCYIGNGNHTIEIDDVIRHQAKKTVSHLNAQGVLSQVAEKTYKGTIDFLHGCAGSQGTEMENVLLLSDDAINKTVPLILCREEDVEGNHGATIGEINEETLNYLQARGFDQIQAKFLVVKGRFVETLSKISDKDLQRKAESYLKEAVKDEQ